MNIYDELTGRILANFQELFSRHMVMTKVVDSSFSGLAKKKGEKIEIPLSAKLPITDVQPGVVPPTPGDSTVGKVEVGLDHWKQTSFYITAEEEAKMVADPNYVPVAMKSALLSLAEHVNAHIADVYKKSALHLGTPGTTPFVSDASILKQAKVLANKKNWLKKDRIMVLDPDAEGNLADLGQYRDVDRSGTTLTQVEGGVGRKNGFDIYETTDIRTHVAGHISDATTNVADTAAGAVAITVNIPAGGTVKFNAGDIIRIAGQPQDYSVKVDVPETDGAGTVLVYLNQKIAADISGNPVISIIGDGMEFPENLAFHRSSIAFANRVLMPKEQSNAIAYTPIVDPNTGLSIVLEKSFQHMQTAYYLSILYGFELVRTEGLIRIHG